MELRLEIVSFQKTLMGDGQTHVFDESGGSIGRGRDNAWVLPDPNRYVSTRHAEIDHADGRFRVTDVSTNGVFVNGAATALGRDGRAALSDGDRLVIGDYEIAVHLAQRTAPSPWPAASQTPLQARPGGIGSAQGFAQGSAQGQDAADILDVVGRRRTEPRLGHLEIPDDTAAFGPSPGTVRPPLPTSPPRPSAHRAPSPAPPPEPARPPAAPSRGIPDDIDLGPSSTSSTRSTLSPPPNAPPPPVPPRTTPLLPDDLDDLLPMPATRSTADSARVLPDGVPLLRPVPGTGNREEPLSPPPPDVAETPDRRPGPADHPAPGPLAAGEGIADALAEGLGLDARSLGGLDPRATAATVARAARAAALGIAGAIDARDALARAAGIDAGDLGSNDENPFLTYRSGEAALRHCVGGTTPGQTLDSATRESVTALTVTAAAAAAALDAVLDRLAADGPPGSAERVREIFGTAFLSAYHRELKRAK